MSSYAHNHCSREISRKVNRYLSKEIFPHLTTHAEKLPLSCQLNPTLNIYRDHENHKVEVSRGDWRCVYCNKHFKSEFYMDRHMENKHFDKIANESSVCLADLCPIFGCHLSNQVKDTENGEKNMGVNPKRFNDFEMCSREEIEKRKYRCEVMIKR